MVDNNLKSLYDAVSKEFDIGDFDSFSLKMDTPEKRKSFYDNVSNEGYDLGKYEDYEKRLSGSVGKNTNIPTEEKRGFWNSYMGDMTEKMGAGASDFGASLYSFLDHANNKILKPWEISTPQKNLDDSPALKKVLDEMGVPENERGLTDGKSWMRRQADKAYEYTDTLRQRSDRYQGKDYSDLWKEGDYAKAIGDIFLQASESLPQSLAAMFGGGTGLALTGVSAGTRKYDQLDKMPETKDMPEYKKGINAVLTGTFESLSEKLGDVPIGKWLKGLYSNVGRNEVKRIAKDGFEKTLQTSFKKYGMALAPLAEGIEEVSSQAAENLTDFATGVSKDLNLTDGLWDSFIYGSAGGAQFASAALPPMVARRIKRGKANNEYRKAKDKVNEVFPGEDASEVAMGFLNMSPEKQKSTLENIAYDSNLTQEQKNALFDLTEKARLYHEYNSPDMKAKDRIAGIFEEKVNKKSGNIVTARDMDGNPLYVLDETDQGSLVEFKDGSKKFIPTTELRELKEEAFDDHIEQFYQHFKESNPENVPDETPVKSFGNGDRVVYTDENGDSKEGVIADAASNVENVFMEDGTVVPRENIREEPTGQLETQEEPPSRETSSRQEVPEIPLTKNGKPDYNAMITSDPELFASEWEKRRGPEQAKITLEKQSSNVSKKIEALQGRLDKETDLNKIADLEDEITELSERKERIDGIIKNRYTSQEEINQVTDMTTGAGENATDLTNIPLQDISLVKNPVLTPFQRELKEQGDPASAEEIIASAIAGGMKIKLDDREGSRGFAAHSGIKPGSKEYKGFINIRDEKKGFTPEMMAENLLANDQSGLLKMDSKELTDLIVDLVPRINSRRKALEFIKSNRLLETDAEQARVEQMKHEAEMEEFGMPYEDRLEYDNLLGELQLQEEKVDDWEKFYNFENELNNTDNGRQDIRDRNEDTKYDSSGIQRNIEESVTPGPESGLYQDGGYRGSDSGQGKGIPVGLEEPRVHQEGRDHAGERGQGNGNDLELQAGNVVPVHGMVAQRQPETDRIENDQISDPVQPRVDFRYSDGGIHSGEIVGKEKDRLIVKGDNGRTYRIKEDRILSRTDKKEQGEVSEKDSEYLANDKESAPLQNNHDGSQENAQETGGTLSGKQQKEIENRNVLKDADGDINVVDAGFREKSDIEKQEAVVNTNPTDAQKEAGNYKMGHVKINGFDVTIEQPKGSVRSGIGQNGKEWSVTMNNTYGYIRGTKGKDGDHIDVFVGPNPESTGVFVVDQVNSDGTFDEHKVMMGFDSLDEAKAAYLSNYEEGWSGLGNITGVGLEDFRKWADTGTRKLKPFAEYKQVQETSRVTNSETIDNDIRFRQRDNNTPEEQAITDRAKKDGSYMKAPNGKPTNLNEKQWTQVRTRAFKQWFGDWENDFKNASKIVDENGEPLVVYHGTTNDQETKIWDERTRTYDTKHNPFTVFRRVNDGEKNVGFFFNSNSDNAYGYGYNTYDAYLSLRNPLIIDAKGANYADVEYDGMHKDTYGWAEFAEKNGYDGVVFNNIRDGVDYGDLDIMTSDYVSFNPNQIKSATDNTGEFSKENDDIRFRDIEDVNKRFNEELDQQINGKLPKGHVYQLGRPSNFLRKAGIPDLPIEMPASQLAYKSTSGKHDYDLSEVMNLPEAIANPIATFSYGDKGKSQNILTILEHNGENFLVGMFIKPTVKGKVLEVNSVRNVFPKNSDSIVKWILDGKLTNANKEKLLNFLDQQRTNYADVASVLPDEQVKQGLSEVSSATNIVENFENPTLLEGEISSAIDSLSDELGVKVNKVKSRKDLPEGIQRQMKGGRYPGLYDPRTGEVYLVMDEISDVADAQATMLHEVLGHKGIRGLFGENLPDFCKQVMNSMKKTDRETWLKRFNGDEQLAAEEYVASFAEGYSDPSAWEKVKAVIKDFLRKAGLDLKLSDNDLKYILWKAKNGLHENDHLMESVRKIAKDNQIKRVLFRDKKKESVFADLLEKLPVKEETKASLKNAAKIWAARINDAYADNMSSVKKFQEQIEKITGEPLPDYMNVYMFQNTVSSRNTREVEIFKDEYLKPLTNAIRELQRQGLPRRVIENYLIAKHGHEERNPYMNAKNQTEGVDYSGLEAIGKELGDMSIEEFIKEIEKRCDTKPLWDAIRKATRCSLQKWYSSGMMSKENYEKVRDMYKYYVPLRGFDEKQAEDVYDYFTGPAGAFNSPLITAEGRRSRSDNPIAHISSMAASSIMGGNKNLMKLHFYRLAQKYPSGKLSVSEMWFEKVGEKDGQPLYESVVPEYSDDMEVYARNAKIFKDKMERLEKEGKAFRSRGKLDVGMPISAEHKNEHMVKVRLNGEDYAVFAHGDPLIAQSINGLNDQDSVAQAKWIKFLDWARRQMAANFTTRNIAFVGSNLHRDLRWATETLLVKEGAGYTKNFIANIPDASGALFRFLRGKQDLNNPVDKMLQEFLLNGGETGYTALYNINKYKKMIDRMTGDSMTDKVRNGYMKVIDIFSDANRWAEDLSRFSTYIASRQAGRSVLRSVYDAKEVTVNFNRKGSGKLGNSAFKHAYLFFNAAVQSWGNMSRMAKKNPLGTAALITERVIAASVMGALTSALVSAFGGDGDDAEEEYWGLPDWVRKNNICFYLGKEKGFITLPLPIEDRAFYGIGDVLARYTTGKINGYEASKEVLEGLMDLLPLNPAGSNSNPVPDVLKPISEAYWYNKTFTGMPVMKDNPFNKYTPEYRRVYKNTGKVPVWVSEKLNHLTGGDAVKRGGLDNVLGKYANPAAFEHMIEGYLGGAYKTGMQLLKTVNSTLGNKDAEARNIPVLNRFYNAGGKYGERQKVNDKYFALIDQMDETNSWVRGYKAEARGSMMDVVKAMTDLSASERYRRAKITEKVHKQVMKLYDLLNNVENKEEEKYLQEKIFHLKKDLLEQVGVLKKREKSTVE